MKSVEIVGNGHSLKYYKHHPDADVWTQTLMSLVIYKPHIAFEFHDQGARDRSSIADTANTLFEMQKIKLNEENTLVMSPHDYSDVFNYFALFPLEKVVKRFSSQLCWYNNTIPYMLAYAAYCGYERIYLEGIDYTGARESAQEHACTAAWITFLRTKGFAIEIVINPTSLLMDTYQLLGKKRRDFYGFSEQPEF